MEIGKVHTDVSFEGDALKIVVFLLVSAAEQLSFTCPVTTGTLFGLDHLRNLEERSLFFWVDQVLEEN